MPTLTFTGSEGCPDQVEWNGVVFPVGVAVPLDMGKPLHRHMLEKAHGNPFFEAVDEDEIGVPVAIPDPEYHAAFESMAEAPTEDATATDYVPADEIAEMDKEALRAALEALGMSVDGRWSADTMRKMLGDAYASHV